MEQEPIRIGIIEPGRATPSRTFGGLSPEEADPDARVVLIPAAYDRTASYRAGARRGPQALLEASAHLELYDEEFHGEPCRVGVHTLPLLDLGTAQDPQEASSRVEAVVGRLLDRGKFPFLLGGEHSLTVGAVRAVAERFDRLGVLQLDAHADLRDEFEGSPYSHACVARRLSELEGVALVQVGVRSLSADEAAFLKHEHAEAEVVTLFEGQRRSDPAALEAALAHLRDPVYVTLDLDVLDPGLMPAVGTPEPGGWGWYELLDLLRAVGRRHRVVGCDVVELCPLPGMVAPDFTAAKLVYKMIGYFTYILDRERGGGGPP